jgi:hypothetical protein
VSQALLHESVAAEMLGLLALDEVAVAELVAVGAGAAVAFLVVR